MRAFILLAGLLTTPTFAATIEGYRPFEDNLSSLKDVQTYEFNLDKLEPQTLKTGDGRTFTINQIEYSRSTTVDKDRALQFFTVQAHVLETGKRKPEIIYVRVQMEKPGDALVDKFCDDAMCLVRSLDLEFKFGKAVDPEDDFGAKTLLRQIRIKSIEVDAHDVVTTVVIAETLFQDTERRMRPTGSRTISN